jgi:hypothetical protein
VLRGKEVITDKEIMEGIRYEYQRAKGVAIDGKVYSVTARGNWPVLDDDTATTIAGMSIVGEHEGYKASHLTFHHQYPNEEAEVRSFAVYAGTRLFLMVNLCSVDRRYDIDEWRNRVWHYEKSLKINPAAVDPEKARILEKARRARPDGRGSPNRLGFETPRRASSCPSCRGA